VPVRRRCKTIALLKRDAREVSVQPLCGTRSKTCEHAWGSKWCEELLKACIMDIENLLVVLNKKNIEKRLIFKNGSCLQ
jgi:hypothetical protein